MKKNQKKMLIQENQKLLENLNQLDPQSDDYQVMVSRIKEIQTIVDSDKTVDKVVDWSLKAGQIILPLTVSAGLFLIGLKFEENDSLASALNRTILGKVIKF